MMHPDPQRLCPRRDEVVALFLDGAVEGLSQIERGHLDEHRADCDDCRGALDAARRLDALVAQHAPVVAADREDVERWIDAALANAAPAATRAVSGRRTGRIAAVLAAGFAAGIAVGVWVGTGEALAPVADQERTAGPVADERDDGSIAAPGSTVLAVAVSPGTIVLPDGPVRRPRRVGTPTPDAAQLAAIVAADDLPYAVLPIAMLRHGVAGAWSVVGALEDELRLRAAAALGRSSDTRASERLIELAADVDSGRRLEIVRASVLGSPSASAALLRALRDGAPRALRAAARIGGPPVDRGLAAWVDGSPERMFELADLLRAVADRPGRVELLLDAWREVDARGRTDAEACAERMFTGLRAADVAALADVLRGSRHAGERGRCLRALAAVRYPAATAQLWRVLVGANRDEALLAAFALGRAPAGSDDLAARRPPGRAASLWLAALASRGELRARREVERLSVTADERAFLTEGGFSPHQIEIAARLFRDRGGRAD